MLNKDSSLVQKSYNRQQISLVAHLIQYQKYWRLFRKKLQPEDQTHPEYHSSEKSTNSVNTTSLLLHSSPNTTARFSHYSQQPQHFFDPWQISQTLILWQWDKSVHCLFWREGKQNKTKQDFLHHFSFLPFPARPLTITHETAICVPFSSFCMSVWTLISSCLCRDTTAEFEGCNP